MTTARVYVFGDSITYGAWDSQGGWCDRIKHKLHQLKLTENSKVKFQVFNLGIGGETSTSLLKRFESEIDARHRSDWPAIIIIATGANDTRYSEEIPPSTPIAEYQSNLENLLAIAKKYTDKILLVGIATVENEIQQFKGGLLSNQLIREYDNTMSKVSKKNNIPKVEVISSFTASKESIYSSDGGHPNDLGHEIIEKLVWDKLEKLLLD